MSGSFQATPTTRPLRIILLTQWFDPEPAFKGIIFARALAQLGYSVEVVTGFPNYPGGKVYEGHRITPIKREVMDGIKVTRLALYPSHDRNRLGRVANYVSFFVTSALYLTFFAKRADIVYAYHPPLTVGLAAACARLVRKTPTVVDLQDMWPDTLAATGMIDNPRVLALVGRFARWMYSRVSHLVVLSPGFCTLLIERGVPAERITVIPNWADADALAVPGMRPDAMPNDGRFNILFAGNMGPAQALASVVDAARLALRDAPALRFVMLGGGLDWGRLKSQVEAEGLDNIVFLPKVTMQEAGAFMHAADALLVHLRDDPLFAITIPSKTQAYLAAGKPIIMAVRGDAADIVEASKAGVIVPPEDPRALVEAAAKLASRSAVELDHMGSAGRHYYERELSVTQGVAAFDRVFRDVAQRTS